MSGEVLSCEQARRLNEFYNTEEDMLVGKADLNALLQILRVRFRHDIQQTHILGCNYHCDREFLLRQYTVFCCSIFARCLAGRQSTRSGSSTFPLAGR